MKVISEVNFLIHPDYSFYLDPYPELGLYPLQSSLRDAWEAKADELVDRPESVLFYLTFLHDHNFQKVVRGEAPLTMPIREDLERIKSFRDRLGERFIFLPNGTQVTSELVTQVFGERAFRYRPSETKVFVFGEYLELCVKNWGGQLRDALQIPEENYELVSELSFSTEDYHAYYEWFGNRNKERG